MELWGSMQDTRADDLIKNSSNRHMFTNIFSRLQMTYERFRSKDRKAKMAALKRYFFNHVILLPLKPFFALIGLLIYAGMVTVEPFRKIRVGIQKHARIGAYGMTMELFLRRRSIGSDVTADRVADYLRDIAQQSGSNIPRRSPDGKTAVPNDKRSVEVPKDFWIFLSREPANRQLMNMIKRRVVVIEHPLAWWIYDMMLKRYVVQSRFQPFIPGDLNDYSVWTGVPPQLTFTAEEEAKGLQLLKRIGIEPGIPFVCFHARDSVYLGHALPGQDLNYHNFRDCEINNCLSAAEYIARQGCFALRMGHKVEKNIETRDPRIIDYATRFRSDFGDIFLPAKCKFFLGSNSGLATIPLIFNRPVALTNVIDATGPATGSRDLTIFKRLWLIEKKRFMTFREVIRWGVWTYGRHKQFAEARIEVIENSADEVLALAQEMNERLDGIWVGKDEDEDLQDRFHSLFPSDFPWNGFPGRIGAEFLRQNRELLD